MYRGLDSQIWIISPKRWIIEILIPVYYQLIKDIVFRH